MVSLVGGGRSRCVAFCGKDSLGHGESVTVCDNPGRPWRKGLGQETKTPCGYTYQQTSAREPEKEYDISALIRYRITWACDGDSCDEDPGDLGTLDSPPGTATLQVGERHAVIVN